MLAATSKPEGPGRKRALEEVNAWALAQKIFTQRLSLRMASDNARSPERALATCPRSAPGDFQVPLTDSNRDPLITGTSSSVRMDAATCIMITLPLPSRSGRTSLPKLRPTASGGTQMFAGVAAFRQTYLNEQCHVAHCLPFLA